MFEMFLHHKDSAKKKADKDVFWQPILNHEVDMWNFSFQSLATSEVEAVPTFQHALQLLSSG
jgi:hypothetical protein